MVKVRVGAKAQLSSYEKRRSKKEGDSLLIGKQDKSLSLVSDGNIIPIKEIAAAIRTASAEGRLSIPTAEGIPFIIQYGKVDVDADSEAIVTFTQPFTNRCFQVQLTLALSTNEASTVKIKTMSTTGFTVMRIGGSTTDAVFWLAIGF